MDFFNMEAKHSQLSLSLSTPGSLRASAVGGVGEGEPT